jgi:hypothetical protein
MSEGPIEKFVLLVLFQAQQDHATELVINSAGGEHEPVRYKVDGTWYDIPRPPSHILPDAVAEVRGLAKLSEGTNQGLIDLEFSGVRLRWSVRMASGGGLVLTPGPA